MEEKKARYIKIAQDICKRILSGEFKEGDTLKGRSMLASYYNVSPETIRKAINILEENKILEVKHGVGIFVDSIVKAKQYADSWNSKSTVELQLEKVNKLIDEINAANALLQSTLLEIIDNFKYQTDAAIKFNKVIIPQGCWLNSKTIGEVYFWNYTEATIVAVVNGKDGSIQASPGPDFPLFAGDTLILVGKDELSFDRVLNFITYGIDEE